MLSVTERLLTRYMTRPHHIACCTAFIRLACHIHHWNGTNNRATPCLPSLFILIPESYWDGLWSWLLNIERILISRLPRDTLSVSSRKERHHRDKLRIELDRMIAGGTLSTSPVSIKSIITGTPNPNEDKAKQHRHSAKKHQLYVYVAGTK